MKVPAVVLALMIGLIAAPLAAQSRYPFVAFAADFDGDAPVLINGRIEAVEWSNPRAIILVRDENAGRLWRIYAASAVELGDKGYRSVLTPSRTVTVRGYLAKDRRCDPACSAIARDLTFSDGKKYAVSIGNRVAPLDSQGSPVSTAR